jgi:hypothetical protein
LGHANPAPAGAPRATAGGPAGRRNVDLSGSGPGENGARGRVEARRAGRAAKPAFHVPRLDVERT